MNVKDFMSFYDKLTAKEFEALVLKCESEIETETDRDAKEFIHSAINNLNLRWISAGNTGCTFASVLSRTPEAIGWKREVSPDKLVINEDDFMISYIFPNKNMVEVLEWALLNGMYLVEIDEECLGLRLQVGESVSWVQFFGQESHAVTRRTPHNEITFSTKKSKSSYYKVGFKGVLHLAHACTSFIKKSIADIFWESSFVNTKNILGHTPTNKEAAKATFLKVNIPQWEKYL